MNSYPSNNKLFFTGLPIFLIGVSLFTISDHKLILQIASVILMIIAAALFGASISAQSKKK